MSRGKEWGGEGDVVTWFHPGGTCCLTASQPLPVSLLIKMSEPQRTASYLEQQNPSLWALWGGWGDHCGMLLMEQQERRTGELNPGAVWNQWLWVWDRKTNSFFSPHCFLVLRNTNCENSFHKWRAYWFHWYCPPILGVVHQLWDPFMFECAFIW